MTTFGHDPCGPPPRKPPSPDHDSRVPVDITIDVGTMYEGVTVSVKLPNEAIRFDAEALYLGLLEVGNRLREKGFTGYNDRDLHWDGIFFKTTVYKEVSAEPEDPDRRYVYVVTDTFGENDNLWGVFSTEEKAKAWVEDRTVDLHVTRVRVDSEQIFWTPDA